MSQSQEAQLKDSYLTKRVKYSKDGIFFELNGNQYEFTYNTKSNTIVVTRNNRGQLKVQIGTINLKNNTFAPNVDSGRQTDFKEGEQEFWGSREGQKEAKIQVGKTLQKEGFSSEFIKNKFNDTNIALESTNIDDVKAVVERQEIKKGTRKSYENLVYPTTLRRSNNDRLKISILEPNESESERKGGKGKAIGSVTLPPPGKISDNNKVDFKSGTLNPLELALAESGLGILLNDDATKLSETVDSLFEGKDELKSVVSGLFVGKAINKSADAILSREAGAIINPNMQLLFTGPTLRPFNFTYKMSPRDRGESVSVQKIIRMFKQSSSVQRTEANFFLRSPNRYRLEFLTGADNSHDFLPKIKTCALLGFGVDYTPEGSYMSYENTSMVSYSLTFAFQEIQPIFNDEYGESDGDIGF